MVSVIIPNYNHSPYLHKRINSVLNQNYKNFEIIILDDCSTDNSKKIIEQYRHNPKVAAIIYNERNNGSPFKQWNKGVEVAHGDFIWIAESDDFADKSFLDKMIKRFNEYRDNIGLCFCQSYRVNDKGTIVGDWRSHTE